MVKRVAIWYNNKVYNECDINRRNWNGTIPNGFIDDLPVALNITGNCYDDINVLNIANALESKMPYKNQIAKEVKHD